MKAELIAGEIRVTMSRAEAQEIHQHLRADYVRGAVQAFDLALMDLFDQEEKARRAEEKKERGKP
jgi:hypothetical protein